MPSRRMPSNDPPHTTGRRTALHAIAALGLGWLSANGTTTASAAKKKRKTKVGPPGPAGPAGPAGSALVTRVEISTLSTKLPVTLESEVRAIADCGGPGRVLSCSYQIASTSAELANVIVQTVGPDSARATCNAFLQRTAGDGSVAGAQIQAVAICLV